ncbi:HD domain-containing protein [bacterium]|nr:HD domain-containing protein [bacterium]
MMHNPLSEEQYRARLHKRKEDVRGPYFRDQTAIIHSLAFRRLKRKTQVFFSPTNDHVCTRIEHCLHVATIAATICKGSGLDVEKAEAIGLGHDLGHAPFGHAGEELINEIVLAKNPSSPPFHHEVHSLRVADKLANDGDGLNLTYAVRDGIISHCGEIADYPISPGHDCPALETIRERGKIPSSWEGCVVRISDMIAYLGRDLEDASRAPLLKNDDIPDEIRRELGAKNGEIINTLVLDVIQFGKEHGRIGFSEEKEQLVRRLKDFNSRNIYSHEILLEYKLYCRRILNALFDHLLENCERWRMHRGEPSKSQRFVDNHFAYYLQKLQPLHEEEGASSLQIVVDYVAGMTDEFALRCYEEIAFPKPIRFEEWRRGD